MTQLKQRALAQELHDSIAQSLSAMSLMLQTLIEQSEYPADATRQALHRIHMTSRTTNAELRRLIDNFSSVPGAANASPSARSSSSLSMQSRNLVAVSRLQQLGLLQSLQDYFAFSTPNSCSVVIEADDYVAQPLEVEVELFRIAQEAVSNAIRHGKANRVLLQLCVLDHAVRFVIQDNGSGLKSQNEGMGLASMRARIARVSGSFSVRSNSGSGVRLQVDWPVLPKP